MRSPLPVSISDSFNTDGEIATLVDILTYHVLAGAVNSSQVTDGMTATMLNGDDVTFSVTDGTVMIGDATVTAADVMASNGIIHVIDMVLMPPSDLVDIPTVAQGTGIHDSLVAAVVQAELLTTLQGKVPSRSLHLLMMHLQLLESTWPLWILMKERLL